MRTKEFQTLLLKSAISVMACDGSIDESEIEEIKNMADNEIYFLGFDIEESFEKSLNYIKKHGKAAINEYINELCLLKLTEKQELLLIEVLIRTIESDNKIEASEIKFLQLVKSKLGISDETIITQFPKQMNYLIDFENYGLQKEFTDEILFESDN